MRLADDRGFDLIGDIHGCGHTLERLLEQLGYRRQAGVWRHPSRMALFLGDVIDRGPRIREALHIVRDMVEAGQALCVMGNHEFYALGWERPAPPDSGHHFLREHTPRHERMICETLAQFAAHPREWQDFVDWFAQLPLLLDAGRFRVVHACWDAPLIERLRQSHPDARIDEALLVESAREGSFAHRLFNRLLRGVDVPLPDGVTQSTDEGFLRRTFRGKFWESDPQTYGDLVFQPDALPEHIARQPLPPEHRRMLPFYDEDQPLLFVGHYWRSGTPAPIRKNLACLDYSAVRYGKLVAYRLDDETRVDPDKFVWVDVPRPEEGA